MDCALETLPELEGYSCRGGNCFAHPIIYDLAWGLDAVVADPEVTITIRNDISAKVVGAAYILKLLNRISDGEDHSDIACGGTAQENIVRTADKYGITPKFLRFCCDSDQMIVAAESEGVGLGPYIELMTEIGYGVVDRISHPKARDPRIRRFVGDWVAAEVLADVIKDKDEDLVSWAQGPGNYNPLIEPGLIMHIDQERLVRAQEMHKARCAKLASFVTGNVRKYLDIQKEMHTRGGPDFRQLCE